LILLKYVLQKWQKRLLAFPWKFKEAWTLAMRHEMMVKLWVLTILALTLAAPVRAQVAGPGRGHGMGHTIPAIEHPESEKEAPGHEFMPRRVPFKVTGQVESFAIQPAVRGRGMVQTAVLKTPGGNLTIFLGPVWFVNKQKLPLQVGDTWEVSGHQSAAPQRTGLVAREVKTSGGVFKLRDEKGQPLWRRMGQGAEMPKE
jgi:hypothetical protein